jgi:predicted mannosyl-3-phosphoglycerate phosphatase (HAD superfamily)
MKLMELYDLSVEEVITEREKRKGRDQFRKALASKGLTMTAAARRTKQHLTSVSRHATGTRNPGYAALKKYSELGIPPGVFGIGTSR